MNQYLANRKRWHRYGESIAEQTAKSSIRWLKENHDQGPFYLHVEVFDPHEPWDPPVHFLEKYLKEPTKHSWLEPPYANVKVPEEGVKGCAPTMRAKPPMSITGMARCLRRSRNLGLYENTVIVFLVRSRSPAERAGTMGERRGKNSQAGGPCASSASRAR